MQACTNWAIVGMRFAKLEQYLIVAFFTTVFDYVACDAKGNPITTPTPIDLNAFSARRPEPRVYLRYKLKEKIWCDRLLQYKDHQDTSSRN